MILKHIPVLLKETLDVFSSRAIKTFVDTTVGGGGHARAILESHPEIERYLAIDCDEKTLSQTMRTLFPWQEKITAIHDNFVNLDDILKSQNVEAADAILCDLGTSMMQLKSETRGFSFSHDAPLDMRMDTINQTLTAKDIINTFSERELGEIFRNFGEERYWRKAASIIVNARRKHKIETTKDLEKLFSWRRSPKGKHPLTRIFQALRIAVNEELDNLDAFLPQAFHNLANKGRLAVISFHSLEDRKVKWFFKDLAQEKKAEILTKKPVQASLDEKRNNPPSRSAKLRAIEKYTNRESRIGF